MNTTLATIKQEQLQMILKQSNHLQVTEGLDNTSAIIMATLGQLLGNSYVSDKDNIDALVRSINTIVNVD